MDISFVQKHLKQFIIDGRVKHFNGLVKTADVMVLSSDNKLLLIQRSYYPFGYALPGGKLEAGESYEAAASRELLEETGLRITDFKEIGLFDSPQRDPRGRVVSRAFLSVINNKSSDLTIKAADDALMAKWLSEKEVRRLIRINEQLGINHSLKDELLIKGKLSLNEVLAFDHWLVIKTGLSLHHKSY